MLGVMYTINRATRSGVTLTCNECSHTVRANEFDDRLGKPSLASRTGHVEACTQRARQKAGEES